MGEVEDMASAQLTTIEIVHGVTFKNKGEIARMIAEGVCNTRQVLQVSTGINLWVAGNEIKGETVVPEKLVTDVLKAIRKQSSKRQ